MSDPTKPAYAGEAQLVRWADSLSAGRTLTLRLDEEGDLHPFKGIPAGQRMQIAVVLVNDDEEPIGPEQAKKNATRHKARNEPRTSFKDMPRSQQAGIRCNEEAFQIWLAEAHPSIWDRHYIDGECLSPEAADRTLKEVLGIASKKDLDTSASKAIAWDSLLCDFDVRGMAR